jgi:hypothetical protein
LERGEYIPLSATRTPLQAFPPCEAFAKLQCPSSRAGGLAKSHSRRQPYHSRSWVRAVGINACPAGPELLIWKASCGLPERSYPAKLNPGHDLLTSRGPGLHRGEPQVLSNATVPLLYKVPLLVGLKIVDFSVSVMLRTSSRSFSGIRAFQKPIVCRHSGPLCGLLTRAQTNQPSRAISTTETGANMLRSNRLKQVFDEAKRPAMGLWQMLPGANISRILARSGPDWVMVDCEHGNIDGRSACATTTSRGPKSQSISPSRHQRAELMTPVADAAMHEAVPAIAGLGVSPIVRLPDLQPWMVKRECPIQHCG